MEAIKITSVQVISAKELANQACTSEEKYVNIFAHEGLSDSELEDKKPSQIEDIVFADDVNMHIIFAYPNKNISASVAIGLFKRYAMKAYIFQPSESERILQVVHQNFTQYSQNFLDTNHFDLSDILEAFFTNGYEANYIGKDIKPKNNRNFPFRLHSYYPSNEPLSPKLKKGGIYVSLTNFVGSEQKTMLFQYTGKEPNEPTV
jgi:hypothetical protein